MEKAKVLKTQAEALKIMAEAEKVKAETRKTKLETEVMKQILRDSKKIEKQKMDEKDLTEDSIGVFELKDVEELKNQIREKIKRLEVDHNGSIKAIPKE